MYLFAPVQRRGHWGPVPVLRGRVRYGRKPGDHFGVGSYSGGLLIQEWTEELAKKSKERISLRGRPGLENRGVEVIERSQQSIRTLRDGPLSATLGMRWECCIRGAKREVWQRLFAGTLGWLPRRVSKRVVTLGVSAAAKSHAFGCCIAAFEPPASPRIAPS